MIRRLSNELLAAAVVVATTVAYTPKPAQTKILAGLAPNLA
jgi:hypothetical protein